MLCNNTLNMTPLNGVPLGLQQIWLAEKILNINIKILILNNKFNWLRLPRGTTLQSKGKDWLSLMKVPTTNLELWLTIKLITMTKITI